MLQMEMLRWRSHNLWSSRAFCTCVNQQLIVAARRRKQRRVERGLLRQLSERERVVAVDVATQPVQVTGVVSLKKQDTFRNFLTSIWVSI